VLAFLAVVVLPALLALESAFWAVLTLLVLLALSFLLDVFAFWDFLPASRCASLALPWACTIWGAKLSDPDKASKAKL
jgi:hypothetical protein